MTSAGVAPGPLPTGQSRQQLVAEVGRALEVVPSYSAVVAAASGGPDSGAMAHLVAEARPDLDMTLGHVRHGLRDDRGDVAAVASVAEALGCRLRHLEVEVRPSGQGLEAAARVARYAALRRLARQRHAGWLLVGHTADDQAETLLLRLARGTGVDGLAGMAPVRGDVVRPLLRVRRDDVRRFVALEGVAAVADPMNADRRFRRVRARHDALPVLTGLAEDPVGALARLADLARADSRRLEAEADAVAGGMIRRYGPARALPADAVAALGVALARRVVRQLVSEASGLTHPVSAAHVADVLDLANGAAVDLPGVTVTRGGGWIAAVAQDVDPPPTGRLNPPGALVWPSAGHAVTATPRDHPVSREGAEDGQDDHPGPHNHQLRLPLEWTPPRVEVPEAGLPPGADDSLGQVVLGGAGLAAGPKLVVRPRRPGDRVATHGGTKKVQDLLVDAGVPRALRDLIPLVTDGDTVLWIPGLAVDAAAAAAGRDQPELHLAVASVPGQT